MKNQKKKVKNGNSKKTDIWRFFQTMLILGIIVLLSLTVLEIAKPLETREEQSNIVNINAMDPSLSNDSVYSGMSDIGDISINIKSGLFKSQKPLAQNDFTDKTVQMILSKLKLLSIIEFDGKLAGYVKIQGGGLQRCFVGDNVNSMFTVLNVSKEEMEISIADQKVKLR